MSDTSFMVDLVTPEGQLFNDLAEFVVVPAYDGELGFMYLRAPIMSTLGSGEMRVHIADSDKVDHYAVRGGFVGADGQKVVVLASRAQRLDAYNPEALKTRRADLDERIANTAEDDPEMPSLLEEQEWVKLLQRLVR
ncbi:MAG: F0F1 ATP synthase subunit epsilon [Coriobacteriales bacterium]|jgi:F-type H+-transporting ATPase subunit epsilon|nr:F0F1 ATP synthase subunit epsilon [Coriobacteriales bacterium]